MLKNLPLPLHRPLASSGTFIGHDQVGKDAVIWAYLLWKVFLVVINAHLTLLFVRFTQLSAVPTRNAHY